MSLFHQMQESAFTDWFLGSESIWAYPMVLTLHTVGLAMLVGASLIVHLRVLQVGTEVPLARLRSLYRIVWTGFGINLLTGLVLFVTQAAERVVDPVFYIKMGSVFVALWLGARVKRQVIVPVDVSIGDRAKSRGLSAAALLFWTTAIVTGRLMAYLKG